MSKLIETLKNNGWVETTLGECQMGDEALVMQTGESPRALRVTRPTEWRGDKGASVSTNDGCSRRGATPVLREPRPERPRHEPGTVALITWDEGYGPVRDLLPVRAMMGAEGAWHSTETDPPSDPSRVEVIRVLLPAAHITPTVEVTDEMVERAAEARYFASYEGPTRSWDKVCEAFPDAVVIFRREARAALKAALENEKEK